MKKKKKGFSKKLLVADYTVTSVLLVAYFICVAINGIYLIDATNKLIAMGVDPSLITITTPFSLDGFVTFFSIWIGQLAISSYAYYSLVKRERKMEMPMILLENLPQDIKEKIDMTQIITTILSCSE